jgi:hypothetical protein
MGELNAERLIAAAEVETGLNDWGGDGFREPLHVLVDALRDEAHLEADGLTRTCLHLANILEYRLRLVDDRKRFPEIAQQIIKAPIFMTGMPRAGTSLLNSLMAQDQSNQPTYHWQMWCPSPPPNDSRFDHSRQISRAQELIDFQGYSAPEMRSKHHYAALNAEEDGHLCEFSLLSNNFTAYWNVPSYFEYLSHNSYVPAYEWHKLALQALQVGARGKQWTLKAPGHLFDLRPLKSVYPDARFVLNHRDPAKVIASVISMISVHFRLFGNEPRAIGREFVLGFADQTASAWEDTIRLRQDEGMEARFVDINYVDLERSPLSEVRRAYAHLGLELAEVAEQAMEHYLAENRKGKFGAHTYSLESYDVSPDEVRERFARYIEYFDVPIECAG